MRIEKGIRVAFEHFRATLEVIQSVPRFLECVSWSVLVWVMVVATYWSVAHAIGGALAELSLGALTLIMLASVTGSVAQLPGVGGGPQLAIALTLTELFGIALAPATAMALTTWGILSTHVVLPACTLAAREGARWSRIRSLLQSEPHA